MNQQDHLELFYWYPESSKGPDTMLNEIALSISPVEKCTPMQVVKQPEHKKASTTEEQKWKKRQTKGTKDEQNNKEQGAPRGL